MKKPGPLPRCVGPRDSRAAAPAAVGVVLALLCAATPAQGQVFQLKGLRAAFGAGYESSNNTVTDGYNTAYDDTMFSPLMTVQGSLAVLDPRVLQFDALVDLRLNQHRHRSEASSYDGDDWLGNVRLDTTILSGRSAPLRLYYYRADSQYQQRQFSPGAMPLDLARFGEERTKGFAWDVSPRKAPRLSVAGFKTNRHDYGGLLAGQDNRSELTRLEARANQTHEHVLYDVSFTRDASRFDYPFNGVSADQSIDMLRATATMKPAKTLSVDLSAHGSRFDFSAGDGVRRRQGFNGWGGGAGLRWDLSQSWAVVGDYSMSSNLAELALSSAAGADAAHRITLPEQPADGAAVSLTRQSLYQEGSGWLRYATAGRSTTWAVGAHALSLDPLPIGMATLDVLRTVNARADHSRVAGGLDLGAGVEAAYGEARSSRGERADYLEAGGRLRIGRQTGRVRPAVDGGVRRTTAPYFYPVGGESWYAGADLDVGISASTRIRAAARQSWMLRDTVVQQGNDRSRTYSAGLTGRRLEVNYEHLDVDSSAIGLLETWLLQDMRPDEILLTRPDLFGLLYSTTQRSRILTARLNLGRGLSAFARGQFDRRQYVGGYLMDQRVAQAGIVWGVRELQLEAGWERFEYTSAGVVTRNERAYVRFRRDVRFR